ncbi:MAG: hypothetical protein LKG38_00030 [Atopobiaceae bacterium]|jgi:hypothetical protein|nr:hypothetical protein [Atopobiaceae bacterium]MCH4119873.1 hypothetical protein [Atopobiaceae bacterium]MCI1317717.1 hypothetical protein [Atopobiaceae bacterium]MCI1389154.1 hypothetical protein [Atopobiaceae bacterium]MCI1432835.1 hypothetical protein [Atopobiaceae bacterium]
MPSIREVFERGQGILQLTPTWVPRPFNKPAKRLRLHPDDYFAFGMDRGQITERWFSSITPSASEGAGPTEGMSWVNVDGVHGHEILFRDFVEELGADLIGQELMDRFGTWPMYSKFYDNVWPLFHHIHQDEEDAAKVGLKAKPEHYFYPKQYNQTSGNMPITYFGFDPSVSKEEVLERLREFDACDNRLTELSRAFRLELDTGWYTPAGMVHAPGSLCTYEPQWNSDIMAVWENNVYGEVFDKSWLHMNMPEETKDSIEDIFACADWEMNTDPNYREHYFRRPVPEKSDDSYRQYWICYGNPYVGAKELIVEPGKTATVTDDGAYGCVVIEGHGRMGAFKVESPTLIRFGQFTNDEFFVGHDAAVEGVTITNESDYEDLVILKHFGPDHKIIGPRPDQKRIKL